MGSIVLAEVVPLECVKNPCCLLLPIGVATLGDNYRQTFIPSNDSGICVTRDYPIFRNTFDVGRGDAVPMLLRDANSSPMTLL